MEELPNGFTGFAHLPNGFVSAGEASRRSRGIVPNADAGAGIGIDAASGTGAFGAAHARPSERRQGRHTVSGEAPSKPIPFDESQLAQIDEAHRRGAWVRVSLAAVRHNVAQARRFLQPRCKLMAVVSADGYGHGAVQLAKAACGAGADRLAVATLPEALQLRQAGIATPILLLSQPPKESAPLLVAHSIVPAVYEPDFAIAYAEVADAHGMTAPYHLLLNTGMNHIGLAHDEAVEFLGQVDFHRALRLEGVFTEFATADCAETLDFRIQAKRFDEAVSAVRQAGFDPGVVHAADSAAIFRFPEVHYDMVRLGAAMCGLHPCPETRPLVELRPAMSVHARIVDARMPGVSEGVSHGLRYRSPGSVKVCTIPIGYADGLGFALSGNIDFITSGRYVRQVGEICPNHSMFEVDLRRMLARERIDPQVGDEVLVVGCQDIAEITMDELADKLHSVNTEVAQAFGLRLPRVYE